MNLCLVTNKNHHYYRCAKVGCFHKPEHYVAAMADNLAAIAYDVALCGLAAQFVPALVLEPPAVLPGLHPAQVLCQGEIA